MRLSPTTKSGSDQPSFIFIDTGTSRGLLHYEVTPHFNLRSLREFVHNQTGLPEHLIRFNTTNLKYSTWRIVGCLRGGGKGPADIVLCAHPDDSIKFRPLLTKARDFLENRGHSDIRVIEHQDSWNPELGRTSFFLAWTGKVPKPTGSPCLTLNLVLEFITCPDAFVSRLAEAYYRFEQQPTHSFLRISSMDNCRGRSNMRLEHLKTTWPREVARLQPDIKAQYLLDTSTPPLTSVCSQPKKNLEKSADDFIGSWSLSWPQPCWPAKVQKSL